MAFFIESKQSIKTCPDSLDYELETKMNIANINWIDIKNKLDATSDSEIKEHNSKTIFDEDKKKSNGSSKRIYKLEMLVENPLSVFWDKLFQVLASIEPIKIDDQYSPLETMKNIPDIINTPYGSIDRNNFRAIVEILNDIPRSYTLPGKASEHPQWSQLVPLWLAAYKHYKNIPYSAWIKDKYIGHLIGKDLWKEIKEIPEDFVFDVSRLAEFRHNALTTKINTASITSPIRKSFYITEDWKIRLNSKVGAMYLQIWLANVQLRHPDMILDPINWDNMPTPYDAILENTNTITRHTKVVEDYYDKLPF